MLMGEKVDKFTMKKGGLTGRVAHQTQQRNVQKGAAG
jgi:hypothetical protein